MIAASLNGASNGAAAGFRAVVTRTQCRGSPGHHPLSPRPVVMRRRSLPQTGLIEAAEATGNPWALSYALLAFGAPSHADPVGRSQALRRGLQIAEDSGNRFNGHIWRPSLPESRPNTATRFTRSTTSPWRSTITTTRATRRDASTPGYPRYASRPDRTLRTRSHHRRFRVNPLTAVTFPELRTAIAHLRDVLGDQAYESLARKGETLSTAEIATYAYDQIDQARAELNAVSK